jgi:hypothetical protein
MKAARPIVVLLFFIEAVAQPPFHGTIHAIALDSDGHPARGIRLVADQLEANAATGLGPAGSTRTDQQGRFRFETITTAGTYTVFADDKPAGYSRGSNWPSAPLSSRTVNFAPGSPNAELYLRLPPQAGFLFIDTSNRKTRKPILRAEITVLTDDEPAQLVFRWTGYSDRVVLVPSNRTLLLHISSSGFHEWSESLGKGWPVRLRRMERLTLRVALDPGD